MIKIIATVLLLMTIQPLGLSGQDQGPIEGLNARHYQVVTHRDTIHFIKLDGSIASRKPLFVMLQGSLPIPLVIKDGPSAQLTSFPYDYKEVVQTHHIINISMPDLPLVVDGAFIRSNGAMANPPPAYNRNNFLDNYVRRLHEVLDYLKDQRWVDPSEIILLGHSQGSSVAIKCATQRSDITVVGLSACNPLGRFEAKIRKARLAEQRGEISSLQAQVRITELYDQWKYYSDNREDDTRPKGDTNKATFSFSENFIDDLLTINKPLYIMYGSRDESAVASDYLPVVFEAANKYNYQMAVYPGLGHNFEEIRPDGSSDFENIHWQQAFDSFWEWSMDQAELTKDHR